MAEVRKTETERERERKDQRMNNRLKGAGQAVVVFFNLRSEFHDIFHAHSVSFSNIIHSSVSN